MNILVANDDGITSEGIKRLVEALSKEAEVYVVAPDSQRSGASHSITMFKKLTFVPQNMEYAKKAYSFTGTPADCVKMGLALLENQGIKIDMIFSGINHGGNLGTDVIYSGTVGAAREGLVNNKLSVAVSVNNHQPENFEGICDIAAEFVKYYKENGLPNKIDFIWNINSPDLPKSKIKGVKLTKLGIRDYTDWFNPVYNDDGSIDIVYGGKPISMDVPKSVRKEMADVIAVDEGYITITPIIEDLTCEKTLDNLSKKEGIKELI